MDEHETALAARVQAVAEGAEVEVDRDTVTLRGQVRDAQAITRIEDAVRGVDGVSVVVTRLVVGS